MQDPSQNVDRTPVAFEALDVLHIASGASWAGAEAQVAMLATAQAQRGHRVRVATFSDGELSNRLRKAKVETRVFDERLGALSVWGAMRTWFASDHPMVVHAHNYKEAILGFTAAVGLNIARVRTEHGVPEVPHGMGGGWMRVYETVDRLLSGALGVHWMAVSQPIESELRKLFGLRVHRVANSVSIRPATRSPDDLRKELGLGATTAPVVLYAGRLEPIKGPDILIEAFPALLKRWPDATLLMAGAGSSELSLQLAIDGAGLGQRLHLLGDRRDIFDLMALADLFVLPSRGEGMPTVLLEALACGCPVVATNVGAISEATRNGVLAKLVPPERPTELAEACIALLDDPTGCSERVALGVAEISSRFSPERAAEEADAVYAAALCELKHRPVGHS